MLLSPCYQLINGFIPWFKTVQAMSELCPNGPFRAMLSTPWLLSIPICDFFQLVEMFHHLRNQRASCLQRETQFLFVVASVVDYIGVSSSCAEPRVPLFCSVSTCEVCNLGTSQSSSSFRPDIPGAIARSGINSRRIIRIQ